MKGKYNSNVHATLLAAVGGYILYLAWMLLEKYLSNAGEMPPALNILAVIVLGAGGIGTIAYAWFVYRKGKKTEAENGEETDDENRQSNK